MDHEELAGMDHGDMALFQPERFADKIRALEPQASAS